MDHESRNKFSLIHVSGFMLYVLFDQITKAFFVQRDFFIGPIKFSLVKNYGLPFNLNFGALVNLLAVVVVLVLLIYYFLSTNAVKNYFAFSLIFGGAISNLADRIIFGHVRDFINIGLFTFNLADMFIVIGLMGLLLSTHEQNIRN